MPSPKGILPTQVSNPALQVNSLPSEPPENPKNSGVGKSIPSLGDLPDPGIERGLLNCRWIVYKLRYQGNTTCRVLHAKCWDG